MASSLPEPQFETNEVVFLAMLLLECPVPASVRRDGLSSPVPTSGRHTMLLLETNGMASHAMLLPETKETAWQSSCLSLTVRPPQTSSYLKLTVHPVPDSLLASHQYAPCLLLGSAGRSPHQRQCLPWDFGSCVDILPRGRPTGGSVLGLFGALCFWFCLPELLLQSFTALESTSPYNT